MITAMPNGGIATMYQDSYDGKWPAETLTIREFIPFLDQNYRTISTRGGHAIEGFSIGGRGATRLAMKYLEMFVSLFDQSGNVMHTSEEFKPSDPASSGYLGPDKQRYIENDAYLLLRKNLDKIKGQMRVHVWCGTQDPGHLACSPHLHGATPTWRYRDWRISTMRCSRGTARSGSTTTWSRSNGREIWG